MRKGWDNRDEGTMSWMPLPEKKQNRMSTIRTLERETKDVAATQIEWGHQRRRKRLRVFHFVNSQLLEIGDMSVHCQHCRAMGWSLKMIVSSRKWSSQFSVFEQEWKGTHFFYSRIHLLCYSSCFLSQKDANVKPKQNSRNCISAHSRGVATGNWIIMHPVRSNFSFNLTMALQGQIKHLKGVLISAACLRPAFLLVYIIDSDCDAQAQHGARKERKLEARLMQQLTEMLQKVNSYI